MEIKNIIKIIVAERLEIVIKQIFHSVKINWQSNGKQERNETLEDGLRRKKIHLISVLEGIREDEITKKTVQEDFLKPQDVIHTVKLHPSVQHHDK